MNSMKLSWEYNGFTLPNTLTTKVLDVMSNFQLRDNDIIVASFPKTGTNWIAEIVSQILIASGENEAIRAGVEVGPMELTILPATQSGYVRIADMPSLRIIMTHLPIQFAPQELSNPKKKIKVLVPMRNPKDTVVSMFHFLTKFARGMGTEDEIPWKEFAQDFMDGKVIYGDYLDHLLGWWQMRDDPHFLFLKYEDMKKDQLSAVKTIAEFLEVYLDEATMEDIAEACSFDNMKPVLDKSKSLHRNTLARKGVIGDWKNMFSPEQNRAFDAWYETKLGGTGITLDFE